MQRPTIAKRPARFSEDGNTVFVPLPSGAAAILDRPDYEQFVQDGVTLNWYMTRDRHGNEYVTFFDRQHRNIVTVSRRIMRAGRGEVISYYNGNRLDLRRANLRRGNGPAWRPTDG